MKKKEQLYKFQIEFIEFSDNGKTKTITVFASNEYDAIKTSRISPTAIKTVKRVS